MRRAAIFSFALSSAIMAGLGLVLGATLSSPTAPDGIPARSVQPPRVDVGTCIEAPTAPFGAPGLGGRATLCDDGQGIRTTIEIIGLPPGEEYTAWWLDLGTLPTTCRETSCRPVGTPADDPTTSMERVGTASVQPSGILDLTGDLRDVRLWHGEKIVVLILGEQGRGGPYAQASFVVP
jgi:hypothetical protein